VLASFSELGVPAELIAVLSDQKIIEPFPIQLATLPDALGGRDVLGRAQTGSGKTIAFAIPVVATLTRRDAHRVPGAPRGLILVPTRELAAQVAAAIQPFAQAASLRATTIYGGVGQGPQVAAMRRGIDIVVATPGRLEDLIAQGHCRLSEVKITVLDEADHMADLGFLPAVKRILDQTPRQTQRLLFSATLDNAVDTLVRRYLTNPATHSVDTVDASPDLLGHHLFFVQSAHKSAVVMDLAAGSQRSLLFTRTKHAARKLARQLSASGIPAVDLHGNLSQKVRQDHLAAFATGSVRVLVATDIAARGIHVDDIAIVVHVDPPAEPKAYLHRSGRTARAGAAGVVVTIVTPEQSRAVQSLVRQAGIHPTTSRIVPGDPQTQALTGPPAERHVYKVPSALPRSRTRPTSRPRPNYPVLTRRTRSGPGAQRSDRTTTRAKARVRTH
jgi:superfamily II DNA/RNA helicase